MTKLAAYRVYFCATCRRTIRGCGPYGNHTKANPQHNILGYVLLCARQQCTSGQSVHLSLPDFVAAHSYHIRELSGDPAAIHPGTLSTMQTATIAVNHLISTGLVIQHRSNVVYVVGDEMRAAFQPTTMEHQPTRVIAVQQQQRVEDDDGDFITPPPPIAAAAKGIRKRPAASTMRNSGPKSKAAAFGAVPVAAGNVNQRRRIEANVSILGAAWNNVSPLPSTLEIGKTLTSKPLTKPLLVNPSRAEMEEVVSKKKLREQYQEIFGSSCQSEISQMEADEFVVPKALTSKDLFKRFPCGQRKSGMSQDLFPIACSTQLNEADKIDATKITTTIARAVQPACVTSASTNPSVNENGKCNLESNEHDSMATPDCLNLSDTCTPLQDEASGTSSSIEVEIYPPKPTLPHVLQQLLASVNAGTAKHRTASYPHPPRPSLSASKPLSDGPCFPIRWSPSKSVANGDVDMFSQISVNDCHEDRGDSVSNGASVCGDDNSHGLLRRIVELEEQLQLTPTPNGDADTGTTSVQDDFVNIGNILSESAAAPPPDVIALLNSFSQGLAASMSTVDMCTASCAPAAGDTMTYDDVVATLPNLSSTQLLALMSDVVRELGGRMKG